MDLISQAIVPSFSLFETTQDDNDDSLFVLKKLKEETVIRLLQAPWRVMRLRVGRRHSARLCADQR
jgi:hypothetical protein